MILNGPAGDKQEAEKGHCDGSHQHKEENQEYLQRGEGTFSHFSWGKLEMEEEIWKRQKKTGLQIKMHMLWAAQG